MSISQVTSLSPGLVGVYPSLIYISTNNTLAEVTTTGFLNHYADLNPGSLRDGDMALVVTKATPSAADADSGFLQVNYASGNWSLVQTNSPGSVTLPTIANHIATYTNTTGGLSEDPTTAISGGNIQAGLSGTAGTLASFPGTALKGSLVLQATANTGNTLTTITNAAMGQASTITIPDPGVASSTFVLSHGGTQHIATGNFEVDQGNLIAGSSGHQGSLISYPSTAANGTLIITAANAGGAFDATVTTSIRGQSTMYIIPDPGSVSCQFLLDNNATTQTIQSGNLAVGNGTLSATGSITTSTGNLVATAGTVTSGSTAGGVVGKITLFPTTAALGSLAIQAVANVGNTATIIQTAALGQATTYTIPDPANASSAIAATSGSITTGHLAQFSGTAGLLVDSGVATTAVQLQSQVKAVQTGNIGGAGAGPLTVTQAACTSSSIIVASVVSSANPCYIVAITAGTGDFAVTTNTDPGASLVINYVLYVATQ